MKYTKNQIVESIQHWNKVLSDLEESKQKKIQDLKVFLESWNPDYEDKDENEFGEKWHKIDNNHYVCSIIQQAIADCVVDSDPAKNHRDVDSLHLQSVHQIDPNGHYIACFGGGANGGGPDHKWEIYLALVKKLVRKLNEKFGKVWLLDFDNDCCDDVWTLRLCFDGLDGEKEKACENTKTKYTKKQISEAIKHWQRVLESIDESEKEVNAPSKESIDNYIDSIAKEAADQLQEADDAKEIDEMKAQMHAFIAGLKTKEDLQKFIDANKVAMEKIRKNDDSSKAKKWLCKTWDVLCKVVKFTLFCARNFTSIAMLALIVFACIKFDVGPIEAISKGYEAAKVIYKAADATLTGAKKATDAYSAVQDASENVGDKVGTVIGTAYQATSDVVGNIKRWFK